MIKPREKMNIKIDLMGPEGNAFCLMGYAKNFCKQQGKASNHIIKEMMSGDYENLIAIFEREFGDFVTLYR